MLVNSQLVSLPPVGVSKNVYLIFVLQSEAAMNIEQCKAAIVSVEHCIGLLQVEASHLQGSVNEVLEDFRKRVSMKQECYQHEQAHRQW